MPDFVLDVDFLLFANYIVPSRLVQPLVPEPLLLDKIVHRLRYHSYISAVLISYRGARLGGAYIPFPLMQLNYRVYVRLYTTPSVYFLHSSITGFPAQAMAWPKLPLTPFTAESVIESRDPEGWPSRLRVVGRMNGAPFAMHMDSTQVRWQPPNPEMVADLADRSLGIYRRTTGSFLFLKVSHRPLNVQPAFPLLLSLPPTPHLPFSLDQIGHLVSAWIHGPVAFALDLPSSLTLDILGHLLQRRISPVSALNTP